MSEGIEATFVFVISKNELKANYKYKFGFADPKDQNQMYAGLDFKFNQKDNNGDFVAIINREIPNFIQNEYPKIFIDCRFELLGDSLTLSPLQEFYFSNEESNEVNNTKPIFKVVIDSTNTNKIYTLLTEEKLRALKSELHKTALSSLPEILKPHENANAFLLNGEFYHFTDDEINFEPNKKYDLEFVFYDDEKDKIYYFSKSKGFKIENQENEFKFVNQKTINNERWTIPKIVSGCILALAAIAIAAALYFSAIASLIALPLIVGLGCLGGGLIVNGSYYKNYMYSLEKVQEVSEEQIQSNHIQDDDDPIWGGGVDSQDNPLFNGDTGNPLDNYDFEEAWGDNII